MLTLLTCLEAIKVNCRIEWLKILLVVCLSIELVNADSELLDILDDQVKSDLFLDLERFFVRQGEFKLGLVSNPLEQGKVNIWPKSVHSIF